MKWKEIEKKIAVRWLDFSHRHRDSHKLPFALFAFIFLDGFMLVIPSLLILVAVVSISPRRAWLFAFLFGVAAASNNAITYGLGRALPPEQILKMVDWAGMHALMDSAREALANYGPFAAFLGSLAGLPTQLMTALLGINDAQRMLKDAALSPIFFQAILYVFSGQFLKAVVVTLLCKRGVMKLEKMFGKYSHDDDSESKSVKPRSNHRT